MDDFTKGLGTKLMLFLWHVATDHQERDRTSGGDLATRVVDGLRSDSFEHESELAEIVQEYVSGFRGAPDQYLAAQFGSALLAIVAGDGDAREFLSRMDAARESIPKLPLSPAAMQLRRQRLETLKRKALGHLRRIGTDITRTLKETRSSNQIAPPNRRPARQGAVRTPRSGGGR